MKFILTMSFKGAAALAILCCVLSVSCSKILNKDPETTLDAKQYYRNIYDADAAVLGVYGKFIRLAKQYVILNELRADLMGVTDNADNDLREVNIHNTSQANPYADPKAYYSLINQCNDVLENFNIMLLDNKFKLVEYQQRYSDVGCIRSWLYLQLGIHYGSVPYVTDALEDINAVRDTKNFPVIPFNQLLDSLISFTSALPYKLPYPSGTSLTITVDGTSTNSFFIEKNVFLGDLYLWKGNYTMAATYYRALMEGNGYFFAPGSAASYDNFKNSNFSSAPPPLNISYVRFKENDLKSFIDNNTSGWRSMFARSKDAVWNSEMYWVLPFNSSFSPTNPFIELFSNVGGSYLVKPSQYALDNWNSQVQNNKFPYDARGLMTCRIVNGQPVIVKYLYNYINEAFTLVNILQKNGQWFLGRAAAVHLHFAEAANRDGKSKLAYALLNNGISSTFDTSAASGRDVTNLQNTLSYSPPYDFDARNGEVPRFRSPWHRNQGIRTRANLVSTPATDTLNMIDMENSIISEAGLELAYEGYRWPDLLRIAIRRDDPSFIADKIYNKLLRDGNPAASTVRAKLMNKEYYLPFKW